MLCKIIPLLQLLVLILLCLLTSLCMSLSHILVIVLLLVLGSKTDLVFFLVSFLLSFFFFLTLSWCLQSAHITLRCSITTDSLSESSCHHKLWLFEQSHSFLVISADIIVAMCLQCRANLTHQMVSYKRTIWKVILEHFWNKGLGRWLDKPSAYHALTSTNQINGSKSATREASW